MKIYTSHTSTGNFAGSVRFLANNNTRAHSTDLVDFSFCARVAQTYLLLRHGFRRPAGLHPLAPPDIGPLHFLHGHVELGKHVAASGEEMQERSASLSTAKSGISET